MDGDVLLVFQLILWCSAVTIWFLLLFTAMKMNNSSHMLPKEGLKMFGPWYFLNDAYLNKQGRKLRTRLISMFFILLSIVAIFAFLTGIGQSR